jgi:TolA-binding protein
MGLAVGVFFATQQAGTGAPLYEAFLKGVGAAAAVMVLAGLAQRLHAGDKVESAQLPGGAGAAFETAEAATKTRLSIEQLNERVTTQSEQMITMQAQLDHRVSDLEDAAFKDMHDAREKSGQE